MSAARDARLFLRAHRAAALSTLSARLPGYPFGSVVPFVSDHAARPIILVSALAEHTRNLAADPRASLLVQDEAIDVQAAARLTLVGEAVPLGLGDPAARGYVRRFPEAERLLALGDFSFRAITARELLFVQGFGRIDRIGGAEFAPPPNRLAESEEEMIAHMNADDVETLRLYCRALSGVEAADPIVVGIDCDGFDVRADSRLLRFDFDAPALDAGAVRAALAALARRARGH
jgi:putative heme iron utilization protein